MTMTADLVGRAAAAQKNPTEIPSRRERNQEFGAQLRANQVEREGKNFFHLEGYASTVDQPYEMYDWFGPYTEVIDRAAFDETLASDPDVSFLLNHRGTTMARTKAKRASQPGSLFLAVDEHGLKVEAYLNTERSDVRDMVHAIDDGDIDQMSFAFRITEGVWSPDYTEYRITKLDLERGDVSAVNYGANPHTSISARSKVALDAVGELPEPVLREIRARIESRLAMGTGIDVTSAGESIDPDELPTEKTKRRVSYGQALLRDDIA